jgi:hypothetical protein
MTAYVAPSSSTSPSAGNPSASGPGRRAGRLLARAAAGVAGGLAALTMLASLASGSAGAATNAPAYKSLNVTSQIRNVSNRGVEAPSRGLFVSAAGFAHTRPQTVPISCLGLAPAISGGVS